MSGDLGLAPPNKYGSVYYKHFLIASSSGEIGCDLSLPIEPLGKAAIENIITVAVYTVVTRPFVIAWCLLLDHFFLSLLLIN